MMFSKDYISIEPSRTQVERTAGPLMLEFGAPTCGLCRFAEPAISRSLAEHPAVKHLKVEDGAGRPLGRSFGVRLWPTLVFMRDGHEVSRLVRPTGSAPISDALNGIDA